MPFFYVQKYFCILRDFIYYLPIETSNIITQTLFSDNNYSIDKKIWFPPVLSLLIFY